MAASNESRHLRSPEILSDGIRHLVGVSDDSLGSVWEATVYSELSDGSSQELEYGSDIGDETGESVAISDIAASSAGDETALYGSSTVESGVDFATSAMDLYNEAMALVSRTQPFPGKKVGFSVVPAEALGEWWKETKIQRYVPRNEHGEILSIGSIPHVYQEPVATLCTPCVFFFRSEGGCSKGLACPHCHSHHDIRTRLVARKTRPKRKSRQNKSQAKDIEVQSSASLFYLPTYYEGLRLNL